MQMQCSYFCFSCTIADYNFFYFIIKINIDPELTIVTVTPSFKYLDIVVIVIWT